MVAPLLLYMGHGMGNQRTVRRQVAVEGIGATTLGAFGVRVRTIEHLMAAAAALGIDNLVADMSAEEVPALDGSSKPFVDLLYSAGAVTLPVPRRPLAVREP